MAQLTTLDTGWLKAGDSQWHPSLATGAVAVVNGVVPDFDLLKDVLAQRLRSMPRYAQVLRAEWVEHPQFDPAQHMQRMALPSPGDDAELFRAIAHALTRPLDVDRPLWECWIIEGLNDNRWAILLKIHPCMADGISAAQLLTGLCDDADDDTFANRGAVTPLPAPHTGARSRSDALWRTAAAVTTTLFQAAARTVTWPVPRTSLTGPLITMRRYHTVRVPLADVDRVCRKFGVTADDVALTAISEGVRTLLLNRGNQPRPASLRVLDKTDRQIAIQLPYLPVEQEDLIKRLRTVHTQLHLGRQSGRDNPAGLSQYPPFSLCTKAIQALTRLSPRSVVTLATDMTGPRHRLRLMSQTLDRLLPIPPTAQELSTGVAVLSYGDELVFGITADYAAEPDMARLAAGIELGMARLVALSQDSVLLFSRDRRRRVTGARTGGARGRTAAAPVRR
ncbi:wax ester/triacylglycerol synthase family O-acyltransferase [Mycobacterium persicum]|uniref:diacylglycerol O-acyltransferase n=1 Tax=Mycobacterium persicum TaxID=1487726 RepID=A0A8E2ISR7_9MYCO|nr:wax ester/triacylglycerol synthase domain-containing protein [Mycobacterium persicum]KZS84188.1 diacylglycerol O-acyltransferase [Mycobacterium persicum]ORB96405.1 diacylglycerol O-acyltransferase [Mycobacterium persicum]ORC03105.1 diacylglycerol O-acyltransferase [Mycobacterium persicum]ORC08515.1 wax ester/triacylglycerol synthase family O-acyltransferase [Mycobacterium persicum]VAZ72365.1 Putative diacylglycerol O-acyltransferase [Mycobacterium persicum]